MVLVCRRPFYFWLLGPHEKEQEVSLCGAPCGLINYRLVLCLVHRVQTCMFSILFHHVVFELICFTWFLQTKFNHNLMFKHDDHYSLLLHTSPYSISINLRVPRPRHCGGCCSLIRLSSWNMAMGIPSFQQKVPDNPTFSWLYVPTLLVEWTCNM